MIPAPPLAPNLPIPPEHTSFPTPETTTILAYSTLGWPIELYQFGSGATRLVLIGGIHGGYEANSIQLAYQMIDFFIAHPESVPPPLTVYVIPAANPDGLAHLIGHAGRFDPSELPTDTVPGRFNGNDVDLNRNWGCDWQPTAFWQGHTVSAGSAPFSEIEAQILRNFLADPPVHGVVFWHSAMPGIFAGRCGGRFLAADKIADIYSGASGYPFFASFEAYTVTGDASNWLVSQGIPTIEVELTSHTDMDWAQNLSGVLAILTYFASNDP